MIVDTSAIIAILKNEPDARELSQALISADTASLSAASYVETAMVVDGRGDPVASHQLDNLLTRVGVQIIPFDEEQARIARSAFRDFGRGSGHPAKLNFGDCFSYALASATGQPLLFKGDDFVHTDITPAVPSTGTADTT
jgi:ribonuclease VapC